MFVATVQVAVSCGGRVLQIWRDGLFFFLLSSVMGFPDCDFTPIYQSVDLRDGKWLIEDSVKVPCGNAGLCEDFGMS